MTAQDAIRYLKKIPKDEPVFVLRGQDSTAPQAVYDWAERAERHGVDQEKVIGAIMVAADMTNWKTKKIPD